MAHEQNGADNNELCCISMKLNQRAFVWAGFYW